MSQNDSRIISGSNLYFNGYNPETNDSVVLIKDSNGYRSIKDNNERVVVGYDMRVMDGKKIISISRDNINQARSVQIIEGF